MGVSVIVAVVAAVAARPLPALKVPDAQAFFNEAEAYRAREDFADAAVWYQKALDDYPGYCDAAYNLARIHTDVSPDPQRVIAVLEPAIGACAEDSGIRLLLGHALCAVGRCDEGRVYLQPVEGGNPNFEAD
jgi:tetratricopeptide (TPR) repeat protein